LMARIAEDHACRAIVIEADCNAQDDGVATGTTGHANAGKPGSNRVGSDKFPSRSIGGCTTQLPNIVLSNLDSDLPLYLWWQNEFHEPMDPQLWAWVDRVIYDSQPWQDFRAQMRLVESAQAEAKQRIILCDLNWTRLDK